MTKRRPPPYSCRRTREIGVRVALGASRQRVVVATFRHPLLQVALGIVVGTTVIVTIASLIKYTESIGERWTVDELEHERRPGVRLLEAEDLRDVRVVERLVRP